MARILIAEDAPHILKLVELTLRRGQHQCISCSSGEQAKDRIFSDLPDLVILDVMMPEIDGLSLLSKIRETPQTSKLPVIILTSIGQANARHQAEASGADCFMTKPFSPTVLLSTIDQLLHPES